ncbi:MAG TPA: protein-L-isoaspartate(D-aspartate) O-methyltransferase [Methanoculleus sp.]|jgi:protein-L-isoaspartate(D-aspartate) O-methyltransferase|uniref:protein-L-isoaspartate(D-aspartate) O-methyltransferase n=1 Tax=Methanoculleus sp. TaxID=90427 RepID=UPI000AC6E912|nr:protein-L-isoaspartate(D-aspartate) O-methyltransferase [Methanoculleus sp.]MBP7145207.1 protein-L-isoaspartate(D-aspartate) O-methyltransferase [Methanoculleus sp.]HOS67579.1 protein-L-isoaspartate(D-aspartate) O-methyltransferase [Methanoculleus sp.]HPK80282.1 protein-L-isoaspartate(D-aspartate) O-methyltransferase [Methanoculleus sp.]HQL58312.1 protein-L-isoaspartate(D-aspartate) O-methyltransferase [Methanoculleus sp.]
MTKTDPYEREREAMVEHQIRDRGIRDERVLAAMREVPRHLFVPKGYERAAYEDRPLPIGEGQTISQPYIVAVMTEQLGLAPQDRVLEIGSGSGYQAALLAGLAGTVISIERLEGVAEQARENLARAGVTGVRIVVGDGTEGYPPEAPYDAIIVTAASPGVPEPLIEQLAEGGRLIAPIGPRDCQDLVKLVKREGKVETIPLGGVCFVPLIGQFGWRGEGFR